MKRIVVLVGVVVFCILAGLTVLWWLRSQEVRVSVPDQRMVGLFQENSMRFVLDRPTFWPWETPDLRLSWMDPWSKPGPQLPSVPLQGTPPPDVVAYDVLGVLTAPGRSVPEDFVAWTRELDVRSPMPPLALAGRSDAELLTVLLWFMELRNGSPSIRDTFPALSADPSASVDASGFLPATHPWRAAVDEIRLWTKKGWILPQWLDTSDRDVVASVAEGKAAFGLGWLSIQRGLTVEGLATTAIQPLPIASDRRSATTFGRWLHIVADSGWSDPAQVGRARTSLVKSVKPEAWLKDPGLLTASPDLPIVDQESRRLQLQLLRSGEMVVAPPSDADLTRWHSLLEAVRTTLKS